MRYFIFLWFGVGMREGLFGGKVTLGEEVLSCVC